MRFQRKISHVRDVRRSYPVGVLGNPCSILKKAVFNLTTITDSFWTDSIAGNNFGLVNSNAFDFTGANYIDLGEKVQGQSYINYDFHITPNAINKLLLNSGDGSAANKGIYSYINTSTITFILRDGSGTSQTITTLTPIIIGSANIINIEWSGLIGGDIHITTNGTLETFTASKEWIGESTFNERFFYHSSSAKFTGIACYLCYQTNGNQKYTIPFAVGDGTDVYNIDTEAAITIQGSPTSVNWVLQNECHFNINNGFTLSGSAYTPASRLNIGFDVLGNALTNPATGVGHNGAETELLPPDIAAWKLIDTENKLFDVGGNPIPKSFADMEANVGNYLFCNIVDSTNDKRQYVMFDTPLTTDERTLLDTCYLKSNELISGDSWVIDSASENIIETKNEYLYS